VGAEIAQGCTDEENQRQIEVLTARETGQVHSVKGNRGQRPKNSREMKNCDTLERKDPEIWSVCKRRSSSEQGSHGQNGERKAQILKHHRAQNKMQK
jgi:hypothetical protein